MICWNSRCLPTGGSTIQPMLHIPQSSDMSLPHIELCSTIPRQNCSIQTPGRRRCKCGAWKQQVKVNLPSDWDVRLSVCQLTWMVLEYTLTPLQTQANIQQIMTWATSLSVERYLWGIRSTLRCDLVLTINTSFVQSASSRAPLACEKEQMLLILSKNQVMPSFLDILFTFRAREDPHTRTKFSYETSLGKTQPRLTMPSLLFSGFRIEHCFNLIGVEKDEKREDPWLVRQTAAYHSFDVVYRRSTWIILKGNKLIRERLQTSTNEYRKRHPEYTQTVQGCFLANLRSHLLIFQWSAENWESYIDHLEEMLSRPRNVAKYTPVLELSRDEGIEMNLRKNETWATLSSRQGTGLSDNTSTPTSPARSSRLLGIFRSASGLDSQLNQPTAPVSGNATTTNGQMADLDLGEVFSFDQLQSLHRLGARLQEAINILAQNKRLLEELKQYFQSLIGSKNFSSFVDLHDYVEDTAGFSQRIDKVIREMDGHQARLRDMLQGLDKSTALVGVLLYSPCNWWTRN